MPVGVELDDSGTHILIEADWRLKELCKSLPGATYDAKTRFWRLPVSWSACLALRSTFQKDLVLGERLTQWAFSERTNRIEPANILRDLEVLPDGQGDQDLFPHQRAGVEFLTTARRALLADEPGLGKTAQAIRALKRFQDDGEQVFPALIVCPNTLKKNWQREFARWWPGVNVQVISGSATQRRKQFDAVIASINSCPNHGTLVATPTATPGNPTTPTGSVGVATKKISETLIQDISKDNEKILENGIKKNEQNLANESMSLESLEYLSKSTTNILQSVQSATSVLDPQQSLTMTTSMAESGESSVDSATPLSTEQRKTSTGSTELECTCINCIVVNWESLRTHSRLSGYGSIALARCASCGGHNEGISENRCEVHERELNKINFKAVVADEIHRSKDPKSKQTRALWSASGDADIRFALTGTPIARDVLDLWSILHWLDPKEFPSKTRWIDRMIDTMLNAFGGLMVLGVKPHMEAEFYASINPRMRRMLKARVLPWLPEMMFERRDIEMSAKQKKAYEQMRDNMIAELESGGAVVAPSVLTQTVRLLQFASALAEEKIDDRSGEVKLVLSEPSCKVDALMDDIKNGDFGDDSVAVCAVSRQLIELLSARLTKDGIKHGLITGAQSEDQRQTAIDDFQSGRIKWILFTAQAGGVGVTLTAARRLVMLQRPWSLVDHKQALDRIHRIGSEIHDSVIIMDYVTEGTIEERVLEVLESKADNFEQIVRDKEKLLSILKDKKQ